MIQLYLGILGIYMITVSILARRKFEKLPKGLIHEQSKMMRVVWIWIRMAQRILCNTAAFLNGKFAFPWSF